MTDFSPFVSIITPTLNRKDYLAETVRSVQKQTFRNWEMIIVDDGSLDGTREMIQSFFSGDERVRYIKRANSKPGANTCRNEGIAKAAGEFIVHLDSDDMLAPQALENRVKTLRCNDRLDFAVFHCRIFLKNPEDSLILWNTLDDQNDLDRFLAFDIPWGNCSAIWRKSALLKMGLWDENLPSWQDVEFHVRALAEGLQYLKFQEVDCYYRLHASDSIGKASSKSVHLSSRRYFFKKITQILTRKQLVSKTRKKSLEKLICFCSAQFSRKKSYKEAINLWFWGYRLRICKISSILKIGLPFTGEIKASEFSKTFYAVNPEIRNLKKSTGY